MTDRQGQTALHPAAGRGWTEVVAYLLEHGANPAIKDTLGRTPLDLATTPVQGRPVPNTERIAELLKTATARGNAKRGRTHTRGVADSATSVQHRRPCHRSAEALRKQYGDKVAVTASSRELQCSISPHGARRRVAAQLVAPLRAVAS